MPFQCSAVGFSLNWLRYEAARAKCGPVAPAGQRSPPTARWYVLVSSSEYFSFGAFQSFVSESRGQDIPFECFIPGSTLVRASPLHTLSVIKCEFSLCVAEFSLTEHALPLQVFDLSHAFFEALDSFLISRKNQYIVDV